MRKGFLWCLASAFALTFVIFSCSLSAPSGGSPSAPVFSVAGGEFEEELAVEISTQTPGAVIRYTLDGTDPGPNSEVYTGPIEIPGDYEKKVIRAAVEKDGALSPVSENCYTVKPKNRVATPLLVPPKGIYPFPISVSLCSATVGAEIHYTVDGTEPTMDSPVFTGPIPVKCGDTTKIRAIAYKPDLACSTKAVGTYKVKLKNPLLSLSSQILFRTRRDLMEAFDSSSGETYSKLVEELYKMLPDGSLQVRMTTAKFDPDIFDFLDFWGDSSVSSDHMKILYSKFVKELGNLDDALCVMNGDGSGSISLGDLGLGEILNPCWSPDGMKIIFEAFDPELGEDAGVYVMNTDGTGVTELISSIMAGENTSDFHPTWSPDSKFYAIAYQGQLCLYSPESGFATVISLSTADNCEPDFCPNANKIVFTADVYGNKKIFMIDLDTQNVTQLTDGLGNDENPDWSPDGTQIAFVSDRDGNKEVYVMNADGTNLVNLSNNPAPDELVGW